MAIDVLFFYPDIVMPSKYVKTEIAWNNFRTKIKIKVNQNNSVVKNQEYNWKYYPETLEFIEKVNKPSEYYKDNFSWWKNPSFIYDSDEELFIMDVEKYVFEYEGVNREEDSRYGNIKSIIPIVHKRDYHKYLNNNQREILENKFIDGLNIFKMYCEEYGFSVNEDSKIKFLENYPDPPIAPYSRYVIMVIGTILIAFRIQKISRRFERK